MFTCPRCHRQVEATPCAYCGATFVPGASSTPSAGAGADMVACGYRVEGVIARGGMGVVMRGRRLSDQQAVAMKAPRFQHRAARDRFTREARALATLNSPNILRLLDIDATNRGTPLLITELISGPTLAQRLEQQQALSTQDFTTIARGTSEALVHCHHRGIIHRDIKPENIILSTDRVCLIDFGLALLRGDLRRQQRLTPEGLCLGTPPFAAPEQLANPLASSPASDCYALGIVLKQCWYKVDWTCEPWLSRAWWTRIEQLTHPNPQQRPAIAHLLSQWPRSAKPSSTSRRRALGYGLCLIALGILCAVGWWALVSEASSKPSQQLSGWLESDGLGTVILPLPAHSSLEVEGMAGTRIRLMGGGAWNSGPIRITGNNSGVIHLRVNGVDERWQLRLQRYE